MTKSTESRRSLGDDPLRELSSRVEESGVAAVLVLASFLVLGMLLSLIVLTAVVVPAL